MGAVHRSVCRVRIAPWKQGAFLLASTADIAAALIKAYSSASMPSLRQEYTKHLDGVWPGIRCSYDLNSGLKAHFRSDQVPFKHLPRSILEIADYVEEISSTGQALVRKNTRGPTGPIPCPTRPLSDFSGVLPRPHPTVWEHIFADED